MNDPTTTSVWETLSEFINRRLSTNDRIETIPTLSTGYVFNLNYINNPSPPALEGRTTNHLAILAYPAGYMITELADLGVAPGDIGRDLIVTGYLNYTGTTILSTGNTKPTTYISGLKVSGNDYRVLTIGGDVGYDVGRTGAYQLTKFSGYFY